MIYKAGSKGVEFQMAFVCSRSPVKSLSREASAKFSVALMIKCLYGSVFKLLITPQKGMGKRGPAKAASIKPAESVWQPNAALEGPA